jgi:hypothetical protein
MNERAQYARETLGRLIGRDLAATRLPLPVTTGDWDDPNPLVDTHNGLNVLRPRDGQPGDLVYATYALLTAPWERIDPADEVGCPIGRSGWLARNGLLREPLVHGYAERIASLVGIELPKRPRFVVTHDVDDNFAHLFGRRESWERLKRDLRRGRVSAVRRAAGLVRRVSRRPRDPNDKFDFWQSWHERRGSRPTYFVAARGLFHAEADDRDVAYDIGHPDVRETLRGAVNGAELGVHFSIGARSSPERLRAEREELEEAGAVPVRSARHHWWALGRPEETWRRQATAGIAVDCSLGYNDEIGFRRGIAVPFRPYDPLSGRPANIWALPTVAMDVAALALADPATELLNLLRTTAAAGGAFVLDWHVHAANPRALPGALELLDAVGDAACRLGLEPATPLDLIGR